MDSLPVITAYVEAEDGLDAILKDFTHYLLDDDQGMSPIRAKELAAARIARLYFAEVGILDAAIGRQDATYFDLYDRYIAALEEESILAQLARLSGTRTLAADILREQD